MCTKSLVTGVFAGVMSIGLMAEAPRSESSSDATSPNVHLEGCVYFEETMSTTRPTASTTGDPHRYIVADIKVLAGETDDGQLIKLDDAGDRVREFIGKRVGVTGRIDDTTEMPQLRVTSIREIVGGCRPSAGVGS